ncbi:MAG TPA: hypothetical protein VFI08_05320 [Spirochaetia bacterium]|nr:hypothetical protein [Spirochaetia bacterium]
MVQDLEAGREVFNREAAGSSSEALQLVRQNAARLDLLLMDVIVPSVNVPEVSGSIRAIVPRLPRLFMSGHKPFRNVPGRERARVTE